MRSLRRRLPIRWATTALCRNEGQTAAAVRPLKALQGFATARTAPLPRTVRALLLSAGGSVHRREAPPDYQTYVQRACAPSGDSRRALAEAGASLWPPHSPHYGWNYTIRSVCCQHGIGHRGSCREGLFLRFSADFCGHIGVRWADFGVFWVSCWCDVAFLWGIRGLLWVLR